MMERFTFKCKAKLFALTAMLFLLGTGGAWAAEAVISPTVTVFPEAVKGYGEQAAQTFTVTNTGSGTLTGLKAALGGTNFQITEPLSPAKIAPGETATVSIRPKKGLSANTYTDTLTVTGGNSFSHKASLHFTVTSTRTYTAAISPAEKTFAAAVRGYSTQTAQTFTVTNTGSGTLAGLKAALGRSSQFEISLPLSAPTLAPGETATIGVRPRTGLSASTYTDTLTVTGNNRLSLGASLRFTVTSAQTYTAVIDPPEKTFLSAIAGYDVQSPQTFTVLNTGSRTLTGLKAALGSSSRFEISSPLSTLTLAPGETATIGVRPRTGLSANTYTDTLTVTVYDRLSLKASLYFTVTSTETHTAVISPTEKTFIEATVGYGIQPSQIFTVTNTGSGTLTGLYAELGSSSSRFEISSPLNSSILAPGETATVSVRPKMGLSANTYADTLTVTGSNSLPLTASLYFTVTSTQTHTAVISPAEKTFAAAVAGYNAQPSQIFTVTNTSSGTLAGLYAELGSSSSRFEISLPLSSSILDPGETATVSVRPKTGLNANTYIDTLTVADSDGTILTASLRFTVRMSDSNSDDAGGGGCSVSFAPFVLSALMGLLVSQRQQIKRLLHIVLR
jgi:hypothetical protein